MIKYKFLVALLSVGLSQVISAHFPILVEAIPAKTQQTLKTIDPHSLKDLTGQRKASNFRGYFVIDILNEYWGIEWKNAKSIVFECKDLYRQEVPVSEILKYKPFLALSYEASSEKFQLVNTLQNAELVELSPSYLVWDTIKNPELLDFGGAPYWPYQVVKIQMDWGSVFEQKLAPHELVSDEIKEGFRLTKTHCMACHNIGSKQGPKGHDIFSYPTAYKRLGEELTRKIIDNPTSIRPKSTMAPLPFNVPQRNEALKKILSYLRYQSDPENFKAFLRCKPLPKTPLTLELTGVFAPKNTPSQVRVIAPDSKTDLLCEFDPQYSRLESITTLDPNFKSLPKQEFRGIKLASLMDSLNIKAKSLHVLSDGNYVLSEEINFLRANGCFLANWANNNPISANYGGPVKLVFEQNIHIGYNSWYTHTLIFSNSIPSELSIIKNGKSINLLEQKNLLQIPTHSAIQNPEKSIRGHFPNRSIPQGIRVDLFPLQKIIPKSQKVEFRSFNMLFLRIAADKIPDYFIGVSSDDFGTFGGKFILYQQTKEQKYIPEMFFLEVINIFPVGA